jgi:hypothetical protein
MQFDGTINLGHILTLVGFAIGCLGVAMSLRTRLDSVENELKKMSGVLVELGRQHERLNAIDRRLDDLAHGRGFILEVPSSVKAQG